VFDFEKKSSILLHIIATDESGLQVTRDVNLTITDSNDKPTVGFSYIKNTVDF